MVEQLLDERDEKKRNKKFSKKAERARRMLFLKQFLKENPEHAKHDWEKEFINNQKRLIFHIK